MRTINSNGQAHTLFPHNGWAGGQVPWSRRRQTVVGTGILGNENRIGFRAPALEELTCSFKPLTVQEHSRLVARIDQAKKSGYACIPFFGKGSALAVDADAGTNILTIEANPLWTWAAGDYAVLINVNDDTKFDCIAVQGAAGNVLTLDGNLVFDWRTGAICRPLLFGKFSTDAEAAMTSWHSAIRITVSELISSRNLQQGITPGAGGPAIPDQQVEHSNDVL
jgi:hypothetical protein